MENTTVIAPEALYKHWQGHRGLTRRVINAFPEDKLFTYSIGGMRTFSDMAREMIGLASASMDGIVAGQWAMADELDYHNNKQGPKTKEELLAQWDAVTQKMDKFWPQVVPHMQNVVAAFGKYEGTVCETIFYLVDNEIHHRGQGYVYLRSLGIEPPPFWDR